MRALFPAPSAISSLADLDGTLYQLFSVTFTRDGIFVNFPYHPDAPGAVCRAPVEPAGAVAVNLDAVTSTTTHRIKYSHHVDGRAHFSQDRKIDTRIVNQARRLDEDIPHMFTMSLQGIGQFAPLAGVKTRYTPSRFTLDGYQTIRGSRSRDGGSLSRRASSTG